MTASITFIGDTLLGGDAQETLDRKGYAHAFEGLAPLLSDTGLVVANHEGPITGADRRATKGYNDGKKRRWYQARPESVQTLVESGVGVVSLANNHVLDFGLEGLADTIGSLDAAGISHCGAALDVRDAYRPAVVTVGGFRIAFLSYMQRYNIYTRDDVYASPEHGGVARLPTGRIREELDALGDADLRVVLVHWGRTYKPVTSLQRELAARLREAGADLVIGHHSHTAHGVDLSARCPVFFSLGNGTFGTRGRFERKGSPPYGLLARIEINGARSIFGIEIRLLHVDNYEVGYRPVPATDAAAGEFLWSLVSPEQDWRQAETGALRVKIPTHPRIEPEIEDRRL